MRSAILLGLIFMAAVQLAAQNDTKPTDPLQQLMKAFPKTIELKNHGRLLEFCPDGTCDGFVSSGNISVATLRDFAYLYVYFFSDYTYLDDWRKTDDAKTTG